MTLKKAPRSSCAASLSVPTAEAAVKVVVVMVAAKVVVMVPAMAVVPVVTAMVAGMAVAKVAGMASVNIVRGGTDHG
jgi:hypothetical protein